MLILSKIYAVKTKRPRKKVFSFQLVVKNYSPFILISFGFFILYLASLLLSASVVSLSYTFSNSIQQKATTNLQINIHAFRLR